MFGIIPAGSRTGQSCIRYLQLCKSKNAIRALMRTPFEIENVTINSNINAMDRSSLKGAFQNINSALIVTPHSKSGYSHDAEMTCNMLEEAAEQGVRHVVLVASWTVKAPKELSELSSRFLQSEMKLIELEKQTGLQWTVLRGGYFLENFLQTWAPLIKRGRDVTTTDMTLAPVSTDDIGRCAAVCLGEGPAEHHGKIYELSGPELLTVHEIADQIRHATGTTFNVKIVPASKISGPPYLKELSLFLEKYGKVAVPFSEDVDALIGKNTTVFEWALENIRQFK